MIDHPKSKQVAIIGRGKGATLQEILKHNIFDEVVMETINKGLVELYQEHLTEWSDCMGISEKNIKLYFNKKRGNVQFQDTFKWFIDSFGEWWGEEKEFKIIIVDTLDLCQFIEILGNLYKGVRFLSALFNGL